jgi:cold-inducible RNA-binding protein
MNLYVGNLDFEVSIDEIKDLFETIGDVIEAKILIDKETGQSKGFGFVEMADTEEAVIALKTLNGRELRGRNIVVNEAVVGGGDKSNQRGGDRGGYNDRGNQRGGYNDRGGNRGGYGDRGGDRGEYQQRPRTGGYDRPYTPSGDRGNSPDRGGYSDRGGDRGGYQQRPRTGDRPRTDGYQRRPDSDQSGRYSSNRSDNGDKPRYNSDQRPHNPDLFSSNRDGYVPRERNNDDENKWNRHQDDDNKWNKHTEDDDNKWNR